MKTIVMLALLALACAGCAYAPYQPKCVWWIANVSEQPDVKAVVIIQDGKTHWKQLP